MLHFLYTLDYEDDVDGARPLLVNAEVYGLGEKYNIPCLKILARDKFMGALHAGWDITSFPEVIETVYTTTPASDFALRLCLTPILQKHKDELIEHQGFKDLIMNKLADGEFAMDVIRAWVKFGTKVEEK